MIKTGGGVFKKLKSREVVAAAWTKILNELPSEKTSIDLIHKSCGLGVDSTMKSALMSKALENVSAIFIGLEGLQERVSDPKSLIFTPREIEKENDDQLQIPSCSSRREVTSPPDLHTSRVLIKKITRN